MAGEELTDTTDVIIIGAGPTGLTLSTTLHTHRVRNIVLEKDVDIWPYPRAFRNGENAWRALQAVGLTRQMYTEIMELYPNKAKFIPGRHTDYWHPPFLMYDWNRLGHTSHVGGSNFRQPVMERCMREFIDKSEYAELRVGCTVESINEDDEWVYVHFKDRHGKSRIVKGRFLAGADGKVGYTRKMYLEAKGVIMEETFPFRKTWVGSNWHVTVPTPETHPKFSLWKKGYTPQQVIDDFFPPYFFFLANPDRLGAAGRIGNLADQNGLWHTEFEINEGEDRHEMVSEEKVNEIFWPYLTHAGSRYGLSTEVRFPEDCIELKSTFSYAFRARTCNKWHVGRTLVLGDAAHVFPPYGGQGVRCGMLDAVDLAWRLALLTRDSTLDHDHLFTGWALERKTDVKRALKYTILNGELLSEKDPWKIFKRDWTMWFMQLLPSWRRAMQRTNTEALTYEYGEGMAFMKEMDGGKAISQVFCRRIGADGKDSGDLMYTDDVIFQKDKAGLFQLVQLVDMLEDVGVDEDALRRVDELSSGFVRGEELTTIVNDTNATLRSKLPKTVQGAFIRIASADEFLKSSLSTLSPLVEDYDELRIKKSVGGKRFAIVRPDKMLFATCSSWDELAMALKSILPMVLGKGKA
ncbi:FAD/NAD(P)-binding domain-containing protein [Rhizodiscina lignyota]|uniref:FAD/NAD(P)-binding domain-containing protein n=1 Tax=Rhizodiscina lignyota TaxID=1504668 RepID=A0A9P4IJX9_9PEZI|nr:FAD/NAD(P)-binding domain-containing protein [Rhizodiscina lignyota]